MAARHDHIVEPAERELVIIRIFDAPRELVFRAWTDPRLAKDWFGPKDYPATHMEMDVRPGGAWRGCLRSTESGKELRLGGVFREVTPPERVIFTFAWEEEGERGLETQVTLTFTEQRRKDPDDLPPGPVPVGRRTRRASGRLDQQLRSPRGVRGAYELKRTGSLDKLERYPA